MQFDRKFSIGNVATIITMIAGLSIGYATLVNGTEGNTRDIKLLDLRVSNLENSFSDLLRQLSEKEVITTRVLTELQTDMRYTREAVEQLRK